MCAVKVFKSGINTVNSITKEALIAEKLCTGHPHLPFYFGIYFQDRKSLPYLVYKYYDVHGIVLTLQTLLRGDRITLESINEKQWLFIVNGICSALDFIHGCQHLHNDIKVDNIILSDISPSTHKLSPILIDFGKACSVKKVKKYNLNVKEQKEYKLYHSHLAPELIEGRIFQNYKTDIYSFGKVLKRIKMVCSVSSITNATADCLNSNPLKRPNASGLSSTFKLLLTNQ